MSAIREIFSDGRTKRLSSARITLVVCALAILVTLGVLLFLSLIKAAINPALAGAISTCVTTLAGIGTGGYTAGRITSAFGKAPTLPLPELDKDD